MRDYNFTLEPETISTTEFVWEEYIGAHLRMGTSVFRYDAEQLIEQRSMAGLSISLTDGLYFANAGRTKAHGVEGEIEGRWKNGVAGRVSYTYSRTKDETGSQISNSPRHLSKGSLTIPIKPVASIVAVDVRAMGARRSLDGGIVAGFAVTDVVATTTLNRRFELSFGSYNLFDRRYADPGAEEHLQPSIVQDGRTVRVRVTAKF